MNVLIKLALVLVATFVIAALFGLFGAFILVHRYYVPDDRELPSNGYKKAPKNETK